LDRHGSLKIFPTKSNLISVPRRALPSNQREYKQASLMVVSGPNRRPRHHGLLANETFEEFLRSKEISLEKFNYLFSNAML
jgi:hypothetical protein